MTYEARYDRERLGTLLGRVLYVMRSKRWLTLEELRERCNRGSEAGISARIRELRHMGFEVDRRRRGAEVRGLFEYRLVKGRFRTLDRALRTFGPL